MHIPASTYRIMRWASVVLMAVIMVLLMIEGTWGLRLYHHPVFIALVVAMLVPLGIVSVRPPAGMDWYAVMAAHIRQGKWKLVVLLLSFGAIQMTWYGVNYLPAARNSMHTYTQQ